MGNSTTKHSGFVYAIQIRGASIVKIGHSFNPANRLRDLQTSSPYPLFLLKQWEGSPKLERYLHRHLARHRLSGEWFDLGGYDVLAILKSLVGQLVNTDRIAQQIKAKPQISFAKQKRRKSLIPRKPKKSLCVHVPPSIECHKVSTGISVYEKIPDGRGSRSRGSRKYRGYISKEQLQHVLQLSPAGQCEWISGFIRNYKEKKGLLLNPDGA